MKFPYILLICFFLGEQVGFAQHIMHKPVHLVRTVHPNTAKIARIQTQIMEKRMNLSPGQSEKVNSINTDFLNKITQLQNNTNLSQEDKIKQLAIIRDSKTIALKQVLDENQFKEYQKLHQELQEQRAKRIKDKSDEDSENNSEE